MVARIWREKILKDAKVNSILTSFLFMFLKPASMTLFDSPSVSLHLYLSITMIINTLINTLIVSTQVSISCNEKNRFFTYFISCNFFIYRYG